MKNKKLSNVEKIFVACIFIVALLLCGVFFLTSYIEEPQINLIGDKELVVYLGSKYEEPGVIAKLGNDDVSDKVKTQGKVNTKKVGEYKIVYSITNSMKRKTRIVERVVRVVDKVKPSITLKGKANLTINYGNSFKDPGYTSFDNYDGDLTSKVVVSGTVDTKKLGTYKIKYSVTDSSSNQTSKVRVVKVVDNKSPVISLSGSKTMTLDLNENYYEPGYSARDNYDGDITSNVYVSGKVNTSKVGVYEITYSVTDSSGNYSYVSRVIQVGSQSDMDESNYIMISIKEQKLWYYKNSKLFLSSDVVTGTKGVHDTYKGRFRIKNRVAGTYLVGVDYKSWVDYWMLFDSKHQIGLHDATWRSKFGGDIYKTSGSHGCVNMPYSKAKKIFNNVEVGTLVIVY